MAQIKANPDAQLRFSRQLREFGQALRKEESCLINDVEELRRSWKDERFRQFERKLEEARSELVTFHRDVARFADYLEAKATAGFRIIGRGR